MNIRLNIKADLFTAVAIGIALPAYYKVKYWLEGLLTPIEFLQPAMVFEVLFAFLLAVLLIAFYRLGDFFLQRLSTHWFRKALPLLLVLLAVAVAIIFTRFFFNFVVDWGSQASFEFDIIVLAILMPLLISGVSDRIFLAWRVQEAEQMALSAKYEILKTRLSPHFLFNSLNTLVDIIEEDQELAVQFVEEMSAIYRYIIENRDVSVILLAKELAALRSLIFLLEARHPGALKLEYDLGVDVETQAVVPLAVQTLIENALKHNIYSASQPMELRIYTENEYLVIQNSRNLREVSSNTRSGLDNLANRVKHVCQRSLKVTQTHDLFTVKVPLVSIDAAQVRGR